MARNVETEEQMRADWDTPVRDFLLERCFKTPERLAAFEELLKTTGAVLSGGSVLRAVDTFLHPQDADSWKKRHPLGHMIDVLDLDIYVPLKQRKVFEQGLYGKDGIFANSDIVAQFHAAYYCRSFMRQNGIRSIQSRRIIQDGMMPFTIDVMALRNQRSVQEVVSHFDLTFCQVWFDGTHVHATHPDDILNKHGSLQPDYTEAFQHGNMFIRSRIKKYEERNYNIQTPGPRDRSVERIKCHTRPYRELIPHTVRRVALNMLHFMSANDRHLDPIDPERQDLRDLLKEEVRQFNRRVLVGNNLLIRLGSILFTDPPQSVLPMSRMNFWDQIMTYKRNNETLLHTFVGAERRAHQSTPAKKQEIISTILDDYDSEDEEDMLRAATDFRDRTRLRDESFTNTPEGILHVVYSHLFRNSFQNRIYVPYNDDHDLHTALLPYRPSFSKGLYAEDMDNITEELWESKVRSREISEGMKPYYKELFNYFMGKWNADKTLNEAGLICLEDTCGMDGMAFSLHLEDEPMSSVSTDGMEAYIENEMGKEKFDPYQIRCPLGCGQPLQLFEIREHVTTAFWKDTFLARLRRPEQITISLNQSVGLHDKILQNRANEDPLRFGILHHDAICPFCLVPEDRNEGCAYMTHTRPVKAEDSDAPFCSPHLIISELRQSYLQRAEQILTRRREFYGNQTLHLEFCIECGRPCANHKHFNLKAGDEADFIDVALIEGPNGRLHHDYGTCPVRGLLEELLRPELDAAVANDENAEKKRKELVTRLPRVELFARMTAIRELFSSARYRDGKEERKEAALAADRAATDPEKLRQGFRVLLENKWNSDIPNTHEYTNNVLSIPAPLEITYFNGEYFNLNGDLAYIFPAAANAAPANAAAQNNIEEEEENELPENELPIELFIRITRNRLVNIRKFICILNHPPLHRFVEITLPRIREALLRRDVNEVLTQIHTVLRVINNEIPEECNNDDEPFDDIDDLNENDMENEMRQALAIHAFENYMRILTHTIIGDPAAPAENAANANANPNANANANPNANANANANANPNANANANPNANANANAAHQGGKRVRERRIQVTPIHRVSSKAHTLHKKKQHVVVKKTRSNKVRKD